MLQCVCIPYTNHGTVLHYESEPEFEIDYSRLDFGIFSKEDEINEKPYALTCDYLHDYHYHYNYADYIYDFAGDELFHTCKSVYFNALARIARVNQLRIFYSSHSFDPEFVNEYSRNKGVHKTNHFIEIAVHDFAEVMTKHFDLIDFGYGFMCDTEHVPQLISLIDEQEYGSPRLIPYYKPLASEQILKQMAPSTKIIAFVVVLDFLCHTLLLKNIVFENIISSGNLKDVNDILAKL